jgi:hypothetical protein
MPANAATLDIAANVTGDPAGRVVEDLAEHGGMLARLVARRVMAEAVIVAKKRSR